MAIHSKNPSKIDLSTLYDKFAKVHRILGVQHTYDILNNCTDANTNKLVEDFVISLCCSEFGVPKQTIWTATTKGTRTECIVSIFKLITDNLLYDINALVNISGYSYQYCSQLYKRGVNLDPKLKPEADLLLRIAICNNKLKEFLNDLKNNNNETRTN